MAGGATYSESRACYDVGRATSREVFLVTSHMLTPTLFVRQVGDLSADKRRLGIPAEQPKPKAPEHLFEPDPEAISKPAPQQQQQRVQAAQPPAAADAGDGGCEFEWRWCSCCEDERAGAGAAARDSAWRGGAGE